MLSRPVFDTWVVSLIQEEIGIDSDTSFFVPSLDGIYYVTVGSVVTQHITCELEQ